MRAEAYRTFTRAEWAKLRANTPLTLSEGSESGNVNAVSVFAGVALFFAAHQILHLLVG